MPFPVRVNPGQRFQQLALPLARQQVGDGNEAYPVWAAKRSAPAAPLTKYRINLRLAQENGAMRVLLAQLIRYRRTRRQRKRMPFATRENWSRQCFRSASSSIGLA